MKLVKATILFVLLVPALSQAQSTMLASDSQSGSPGMQQMQNGNTPGNSECVGPHSYCNLFTGS
ncbi:hypothetical protein AB4Y44_13270 [Paraburkholderia sp. BR10937]|uniref:hypothetical protein n=1 Tax=Paraburkholderia sp. BR10937 TaxID=3236994 RepID=UPI0034D38051